MCASGGWSPGSASSSATSRARRRVAASAVATSSRTPARSSDSPAKANDASASTPRQERTRAKPWWASSRPASHRIVLPIPGSPERISAAGPCSIPARNALIESSSWSRPMIVVEATGPTLRLSGFARSNSEPRCELGPRPDPQLPVGPREVSADRVHADEELGSDLLVGATLGRERGDPLLHLGQLLLGGAAPAADPPQLGACLLRPERRAESLEDRQRLLERVAGPPLLLRLSVGRTLAEQRPGALEWVGIALELGEGTRMSLEGGVEIALRRRQQAAAARRACDRVGAAEPLGIRLVFLDVCAGQIELAERDQGLDRVGPDGSHRLVHVPGEKPPRRFAQIAACR